MINIKRRFKNVNTKTKYNIMPLSIGTVASHYNIPILPDPVLHLDATIGIYDAAENGNLVTADGAAIARWEDQSGNNHHFVQSILNNRPVLKTSIQNNKNVIRFNGNNRLSNFHDDLNLKFNNLTIFIVYRKLSGGDFVGQLYGNNSANNSGIGYTFTVNGTNLSVYYRSDTNYARAHCISSPLNTGVVSTAIINRSEKFVSTRLNKVSSQISCGPALALSNSDSSVNVTNTRFTEIGRDTTQGFGFSGDICEIISYITSTPLTVPQMLSIEQGLMNKWGI